MERLPPGDNILAPLIIGNVQHRDLIRRAAGSISEATILLETVSRNTGPSIAIACLWAAKYARDAILAIMPSDHVVTDVGAFRKNIHAARTLAEHGYLVTFGIKPMRPDTNFGYIAPGKDLSNLVAGASEIQTFLEKPNAATAQSYLEDSRYFWNSGIFVFKPATMLDEFKLLAPAILKTATKVFEASKELGCEMVLDAAKSNSFPSISLDHALMEETKMAATIPFSSEWWDLGSINALRTFSKENLLPQYALADTTMRFLKF